MKQYFVLCNINSDRFEGDLNMMSAKGWRLVSSYAITENGEDYFTAVLERSKTKRPKKKA